MTASILAFLCGCLCGALVMLVYLIHMERQNQILIRTTRAVAYREGYTEGRKSALQNP